MLWVILQTRTADLDCSSEKLWPDYGNNGGGDAGQVLRVRRKRAERDHVRVRERAGAS